MDLWVPFARQYRASIITRGKYAHGHPEGLIVHYSAGRDAPVQTLEMAASAGHCYMVIDGSGQLFQAVPLDAWGYHAGTSSHPKLGTSVSSRCVGVEILCAGRLKEKDGKLLTWWGDVVPREQARYVPDEANRFNGFYQKYTPEQEETLARLCWWLKANAPLIFDFDLVLGHDEVSPGRKMDPGGSLSRTMPAFRDYLKTSYQEVLCKAEK